MKIKTSIKRKPIAVEENYEKVEGCAIYKK
jgi:hypothetical protein